jgi:hypothetical protein
MRIEASSEVADPEVCSLSLYVRGDYMPSGIHGYSNVLSFPADREIDVRGGG